MPTAAVEPSLSCRRRFRRHVLLCIVMAVASFNAIADDVVVRRRGMDEVCARRLRQRRRLNVVYRLLLAS